VTASKAKKAKTATEATASTKTTAPIAARGTRKKVSEFKVGDTVVARGTKARLEIPVARLPTGSWLSIPVVAIHGAKAGPTLWLDAALHGDEINGMEVIHRVLEKLDPKKISGRIIAVPVVNVFGFIQQARYLPDRRDLNRHFPGSERGSLASRLAHLFMQEIVANCQYGLDLHTGSLHRTNLPQIRADLENPETRRLAEAFGAPMMYRAGMIKGSLRAAAVKRGIHILTYEAGEPLRFDDEAVAVGTRGVLKVLDALGMRTLKRGERGRKRSIFEAEATHWLRAPKSGVFHRDVELGQKVSRGETLGTFSEPAGPSEKRLKSRYAGLVIGYTNNPLVYQGDAVVHVAVPKTS